jgi:prevent-host-death family protein
LTRSTENGPVPQYNTYDARTYFSELLRRVRKGEEFVIAHAGVPIARLVPYEAVETRPGIVRLTVVLNDSSERPDESSRPPRQLDLGTEGEPTRG